jgi:hypothetical protein
MINLKRQGGWKSDAVVEGYLRESKKLKKETAALITGVQNQTISITPTNTTTSTVSQSVQPSINFESDSSFHNCTFHII